MVDQTVQIAQSTLADLTLCLAGGTFLSLRVRVEKTVFHEQRIPPGPYHDFAWRCTTVQRALVATLC